MIRQIAVKRGTMEERPAPVAGGRRLYIAEDAQRFFVESSSMPAAWIELTPSLPPHNHDDRYFTEAEINALLAPLRSDWDVTVVKPADTSRAVTVAADDPDLKVPVAAGGVYLIEAVITYAAINATPDIKFLMRVTAGNMLGFWAYEGSDTTANAVLARAQLRLASVATTTTIAAGTNAAIADIASLYISMQVRCSAAGEVVLQWAQNTSNASPTIVKQRSIIRARRIG